MLEDEAELDRIEQQGLDFFHRTRQRYLELVQNNRKPPLLMLASLWHKVQADIQSAIKIGGFHKQNERTLSLVGAYL